MASVSHPPPLAARSASFTIVGPILALVIASAIITVFALAGGVLWWVLRGMQRPDLEQEEEEQPPQRLFHRVQLLPQIGDSMITVQGPDAPLAPNLLDFPDRVHLVGSVQPAAVETLRDVYCRRCDSAPCRCPGCGPSPCANIVEPYPELGGGDSDSLSEFRCPLCFGYPCLCSKH